MTEAAKRPKASLAFRGSWFLRGLLIESRRALQRGFATWTARISPRRARERWNVSHSAETTTDFYWTSRRVIREYVDERISGDPKTNWVAWMLFRYARGENLTALVLGCGQGWLDRALAADERIGRVTAVDLSERALQEAARLAEREGLGAKISYRIADLDRDPLPGGPFDLICAHDAIHHVRNLEWLFDGIAKALAPDGALLFCEYVGPRRFAFDARRTRILDDALLLLPEKYRRLKNDTLATRGCRIDTGRLALEDPSEAVRSDQIMAVLRSRLDVLEEIPCGGSLLNPLLYELIANFRDGEEEDEALLRKICGVERDLIGRGELPSDFVVVAARRKDRPGLAISEPSRVRR